MRVSSRRAATLISRLTLPAAVIGLTIGLLCQLAHADETPAGSTKPETPATEKVTSPQPQSGWTSFRNGPQLQGLGSAELPAEWKQLWKIPAEYGVTGTAAIKDGRVYIGTIGGDLLCLDRDTGKIHWKLRSIDNDDPNAFAPGFKASPTLAGGVIYLGDEDGVFHAVDAATGKRKWTFATLGEIVSSATVIEDKILFGSYDNSLYCLSVKDGTKLWSFETDGYVNCTPAVLGRNTFVTGCDEHLRVINIDTGKQAAIMPVGSYLIASPAVRDKLLYFGTYASQVVAVDWTKQETLWTYKSKRGEFPYHSSAALTEDLVVLGGRDKQIHAIDRKTGKAVWTCLTGGRVDSSPAIIGNRLFCGSSDGKIYELDLKTGEKRWEQKLGREVTASPAVAEGVIVIGTEDGEGFIYCFGKK